MKIEVFDTPEQVAQAAADLLSALLETKPTAALLLPAGNTPIPFYKEVVQRIRAGQLDLSQTALFQLDEMAGVEPSSADSFQHFLHEHLLDHLPSHSNAALSGSNTGTVVTKQLGAATRQTQPRVRHAGLINGSDPSGSTDDFYPTEIARHAAELATLGPADLAILGLGKNGHVAFNEPGSSLEDGARVVELDEHTRLSLASIFAPAPPPSQGLTLGLREIGNSLQCLLLVTGASKAKILRKLREELPSSEIPASLLKNAPTELLVFADRAAAEG